MTLESRTVVRLGNPEFGKQYMNYHKYRLKICVCSLICSAAIALVAASIVLQIINSSNLFPESYELGEGDMRAVSVSTLFCEGITLKKDMNKRRLRVLSTLKLSTRKKRSNFSTQVYVVKNKYWYKAFYLLEGSSILINARSKSYFKLIILRGKERLEEWIKTKLPTNLGDEQASAVAQRGAITINHGRTTRISYELSVQESDNYYILFRHITGGQKLLSLLDLRLSLNRVLYDVGPTLFKCVAQPGESCDARLLFGSHESVVIEVMASTSKANNVFTHWQCDTRIWFYIAIFGGCFFVTSLVGILIYVTGARAKRRRLKSKVAEYEKKNSAVNEMLVAPVPRFTRSPSIRSHGSLRRYPPVRTSSLRSQTSLGTHSSVKRESQPLMLSVPMYEGISVNEQREAEIAPIHDHEDDDNIDEIFHDFEQRPRDRTESTDDNVSYQSFSSFDTGISSRKSSFTTFRQRSSTYESDPNDGGDIPTGLRTNSQGSLGDISRYIHEQDHTSRRPRAKSCTHYSHNYATRRDSRPSRSKSFSYFDSCHLQDHSAENEAKLHTTRQHFSFPATVHAPPARKLRSSDKPHRLCCHRDNNDKQTRNISVQKPHPIKAQAMSETIDSDYVSGDVSQPHEDVWVAQSKETVEEINFKLHKEKVEKENSNSIPNGTVKKRDKRRDYYGWKPRLSVVSESEL